MDLEIFSCPKTTQLRVDLMVICEFLDIDYNSFEFYFSKTNLEKYVSVFNKMRERFSRDVDLIDWYANHNFIRVESLLNDVYEDINSEI